ncbi:MAG TPA: hypothetical protein VKH42_09465 [Vicinamibacterales bacterium]|nr:hypothetical protein [Vicinamibacterales bacterium]
MLNIAPDDGSVVAFAACGSQVSIESLRLLSWANAAEWESMCSRNRLSAK